MPLHLGSHFQVSYVTRSIERGADLLTSTLGARQLSRFEDLRDGEGNPTALQNLSHFDLGGTEIELIEPRDPYPDSIYLDMPWDDGRTIFFHHLGYLLASHQEWEQTVRDAREAGFDVPMMMDVAGVAVAYIDMRDTMGHFVEAVYRDPGTGPGGVKAEDSE